MIDITKLDFTTFTQVEAECPELQRVWNDFKHTAIGVHPLNEHINNCEVCIAAIVAERMNR